MKKLISLALSVVISVSMALTSMAATNLPNLKKEVMELEGETVTFYYYEVGDVSYTEYDTFSGHNVVKCDNVTGIITLNDRYVGRKPTNSLPENYTISSPLTLKANQVWKLYNTGAGDLTSDIIDAASWVAVLGAFLGGSVAKTTIKTIAQKAVAANLPTIYYKEEQYYLDPVTRSRPKTGNVYTFYKSPTLSGATLGKADCRVK